MFGKLRDGARVTANSWKARGEREVAIARGRGLIGGQRFAQDLCLGAVFLAGQASKARDLLLIEVDAGLAASCA